MTMNELKLRECPFCGGNVSRVIGFGGLNSFKCWKCGAVVSFDNDFYNTYKDRAIEAWNRRYDDNSEPNREKLVELLDIIIQPGQKTLGDIADYLIRNGVTVQEWIKVKDKLPEEAVNCIVHQRR